MHAKSSSGLDPLRAPGAVRSAW